MCCKVKALRCFLLASRLLTLPCPIYTEVLHDACVAEVILCERGRRWKPGENSWLGPALRKALLAANLELRRTGDLVPIDPAGATHSRDFARHAALLNAASVLALSQRPGPALQALRLFLSRDCSTHRVQWRCLEVFRRLWFAGQMSTLGHETQEAEHALLVSLLERDHAMGSTFLSPWEALMAPLPRQLSEQGALALRMLAAAIVAGA